ncbi:MAG: iron reductase [Rhizobiaceae bacterium]
MSEFEKLAVGGLITVLLLFTPGFVLHTAPRFPGSLAGSMLGIAGAALMVLLLLYPLIKHWTWLRQRIAARLSMRVVLSIHIYAGALGAVLGVLHTGHKFESPLGIILVTSMLVATLSGFVGRYYLSHRRVELQDQKAALDLLRAEYDERVAAAGSTQMLASVGRTASLSSLIGAIADLEYGMRRRETIQRAFTGWMFSHITAALVMYPALVLHIWNSLYFGLRWLE